MANNPSDEPESRKVTEDELRRLYPNYEATCKNRENTPFLFRYGPFNLIYKGITNMFKNWQGQIKDPSSSTGWRKLNQLEERQKFRDDEKQRRNKQK
jgi:hypothetical protein